MTNEDTECGKEKDLLNKIIQAQDEIKELKKGLELAKKLDLKTQIELYEDSIEIEQIKSEKIKFRYEEVFHHKKYIIIDIEKYNEKIPIPVLEEFYEAKLFEFFNYYKIWKDCDINNIIIGVIIGNTRNSYFKIVEWKDNNEE